ncbi:hypothetical protein ACK8P5_25670 (plasmid) [Paenibacillus sp. EC2-1]|uniref:hypothetical protein n=1 Tax=Paenibacillus sp. EC2-1 TaxID=3388665 RepID=UPI003BEF0D78
MLGDKNTMNDALRQSRAGRFQSESASEEYVQDVPRNITFDPPDFSGETEENPPTYYDPNKIGQSYAGFDADEDLNEGEFEEEDFQLEEEYSEDGLGFQPPAPWRGANANEYPVPPSLRPSDGGFIEDRPIFPGGPLESEKNSWKKQFEGDGHEVFSSPAGGDMFVWRTMSRVEYRSLMALPNTDPLQREEIICEICVLFPYDYNFSTMSARKAGVPSVLAEAIMKESAFDKPANPVRL